MSIDILETRLRRLKCGLAETNLGPHPISTHHGVMHLEGTLADVCARGLTTFAPTVRISETLSSSIGMLDVASDVSSAPGADQYAGVR